MKTNSIILHDSWKTVLAGEFEKPYFLEIQKEIEASKANDKNVFPPESQIFNAFNYTPFDQVKVVVLGQDPYHRPGQAMGLCFSVNKGITIPRSLKRIYREIENDLGFPIPEHGDLSHWARQGVFMPNAILTVEEGSPTSHAKIGWAAFTDKVIQTISDQKEGVCFLLWGGFAKSKKKFIDTNKHHVFESAHPSPLAGNAFFGNHHFSKVNHILEQRGDQPIDWSVG